MSTISPPRPAAASTASASGTSFWEAVRLVAGREIWVRLRNKMFLGTTVFFMLFAVGMTIVPYLLAGDASSVAVSAADAVPGLEKAGLDVRTVGDAAAAERLVRDGEVDAAVVVGDAPGGVKVIAMDEAPGDVVDALSVAPPIQLLDPAAVNPALRYLVPMAFGMIFFFTSLTFGLQIAQSITEEKQTRIVEILVATVPVRAMLAGKLTGNGLLAMGQIALTALVSVVAMQVAEVGSLFSVLAPAIGWFIPFFVVGFVLLAAMWAVAGATASRQEDLGTTSMPVQSLVMLPFFAVIFLSDNPTAMAVMSYVPFSAPTAMPLRLFFGDAAPWEPVLSLAILIASAVVFLFLSARLYQGSLLRTNGTTSLRVAWRRDS